MIKDAIETFPESTVLLLTDALSGDIHSFDLTQYSYVLLTTVDTGPRGYRNDWDEREEIVKEKDLAKLRFLDNDSLPTKGSLLSNPRRLAINIAMPREEAMMYVRWHNFLLKQKEEGGKNA